MFTFYFFINDFIVNTFFLPVIIFTTNSQAGVFSSLPGLPVYPSLLKTNNIPTVAKFISDITT